MLSMVIFRPFISLAWKFAEDFIAISLENNSSEGEYPKPIIALISLNETRTKNPNNFCAIVDEMSRKMLGFR